jgi:NAD(P)-dependent dehydrogenase (short-subunit alcohol dehydrogenase family)
MLGLGSATGAGDLVDPRGQSDAVFYLMRAALPALVERGGGSMVVVGSIAAFKGFPNHAAYCASKGALVALVRQVAVDYGPKVRVNLLCPGPVDTPLIWESAAPFRIHRRPSQPPGEGPCSNGWVSRRTWPARPSSSLILTRRG